MLISEKWGAEFPHSTFLVTSLAQLLAMSSDKFSTLHAIELSPRLRKVCRSLFQLSAIIADYESGGQEFESLQARHLVLVCEHQGCPRWLARTACSSKSLLPLILTKSSSTSIRSMRDCK